MKKLYVLRAKTLVWAHSEQLALNAMTTIDRNDMWLVDNTAGIKEIKKDDDVPEGWDWDTCPVDSDRALHVDFWALNSVRQIMSKQNQAEASSIVQGLPTSNLQDRLKNIEQSIEELNATVNKLIRSKLYA